MNIHQYIASGIVESYTLGLASPQEAAEFERMLLLHAPLQQALADFQFQLELFAIQNEVPPPPGIKGEIEDRLRNVPAVRPIYRRQGQKGDDERQSDYIKVQSSSTHMWVHRYWRPVFIIIFILSKIFLALSIYFFVQYLHDQRDIQQLQDQLKVVQQQLSIPDHGRQQGHFK